MRRCSIFPRVCACTHARTRTHTCLLYDLAGSFYENPRETQLPVFTITRAGSRAQSCPLAATGSPEHLERRNFRCVHGTQLVTRENAEKWSCCNKSQPKCSAQVSTPPHKEQQRARRLRWLRRLMQYLAHKQRVPKRARFLRTILAIVRHSDLRARICQKKLAFF